MNKWMDVKEFFSFFKMRHKFSGVIPIGLLARYGKEKKKKKRNWSKLL
jgi:hypothetical protein